MSTTEVAIVSEALLWKDSPNGRRSKAQGIGGEYRIGRYDTQERPWPEHGVVVPAETWFEVQLRGPNEKRGATLRGEFLVGRLVVVQHGHRACVRITWLDSSLDSLSSVVSSPLGDIPARTIGNSGTGCLVLAGRRAGAARSAACTTDKGHSVA